MNEIWGSKRYFQFIVWRPSGRPLLFLFHKSTFAGIYTYMIYIYIIYVYIIVYMCIFIFLCNYIFSFIHTDTSKTRCSEIGLGKSHYPGIEQGASNHRSQGGEKLHKQRSVCSRSEARLEPKQQNKTPRQSTKT